MPKKGNFPVITILLVLVLVGFFYKVNYDYNFYENIKQYIFVPEKFSLWPLFISLFIHLSMANLLINILFLFIVGSITEKNFGKIFTFLMFFLFGIAGFLLHAFILRKVSWQIPVIGCSSAVSGLLGIVWALQQSKQGFIKFIKTPKTIFLMAFIIFWFILQYYYGFSQLGSTVFLYVSNTANVIVFILGLIFGLAWQPIEFSENIELANQQKSNTEEIIKQTREFLQKENKYASPVLKDTQANLKINKDIQFVTQHHLMELEKELYNLIKSGKLDEAIKAYCDFERSCQPGIMNLRLQEQISQILFDKKFYPQAVSSYERCFFFYPSHSAMPGLLMKAGLIAIRELNEYLRGVELLYYASSLPLPSVYEAESRLIREVKNISNKLEHKLMQSANEENRFCLIASICEEKLYQKEKLEKLFYSIGEVSGINLGAKLGYNVSNNPNYSEGLILQNISLKEAKIAQKYLEKNGLLSYLVPQEYIIPYRKIQHVSWAEWKSLSEINLLCEEGKMKVLSLEEINYITLADVNKDYFQNMNKNTSSEKVEDTQKQDAPRTAAMDIFTKDEEHFRLGLGTLKIKDKKNIEDSNLAVNSLFRQLVSKIGSSFLEIKSRGVLFTNSWLWARVENVQSFNDKSIWAARLKYLCDKIK